VPQHTWCTMAEAHAAGRGVSMEGEGAAGVHGFAFRERPVEPEPPVPSPGTRARMDDEQDAEDAAHTGGAPLAGGWQARASDTPPCSSPAVLEHAYPNAGS